MGVDTRFFMKSLWRCALLHTAPLGAGEEASWLQKQPPCRAARMRLTKLSGTWQPSVLEQGDRLRALATTSTSSTPSAGQV